MSCHQQRLKLAGVAALHEEAIRILAIGQRDLTRRDALFPKTMRETLRRLWAAAVGVGIESEIDGSGTVAQLPKLARVEVGPQRAGDVVKAGLPQDGIVEQAFDEDHFRV